MSSHQQQQQQLRRSLSRQPLAGRRSAAGSWQRYGHQLSAFVRHNCLTLRLLFDGQFSAAIMVLLLVGEFVLNIYIINRVKYTEIDWSTYVQQVECFVQNGTVNYEQIGGNTGPIVYPAGHLYSYSALYYLTNRGTDIRRCQYIFAAIYLLTLASVFRIYRRMDQMLPPYVFIVMCCTSYRIHSIYVLRLFNDTIAMLLLYIAINFFIDRKWTVGSIFYSLGVSVKMNILLFAPALLLLYIENNSLKNVAKNLGICAIIQLIIGLPFLASHPKAYLIRSFNLGRIFMHKWTVNWRFLPNHLFISPYFHLILLTLHLMTIVLFFKSRYIQCFKRIINVKKLTKTTAANVLTNNHILWTLFIANFIGIAYSRSLHYQFYVWYFHSLPFLLWSTPYSPKTKLCLLGLIEFSWNSYPSTSLSSGILHMVHLILLFGLWRNRSQYDIGSHNNNNTNNNTTKKKIK
ncbi:lethal(2)neighbour of Tid protein-like [Oppia nitens]|uniref:lethal(2)neighbour of Tid protein-like n=1 Tax=Oppia nitens TaxID=1686743 RepID=UPI0023DA169C|nr:lethal(2)neighbour of Tid protein-like [Oppia nitens]